jgi:hypothetical protein
VKKKEFEEKKEEEIMNAMLEEVMFNINERTDK